MAAFRSPLVLALVLVLVLVLASCGSSSSVSSRQRIAENAGLRAGEAPALLVQCMLNRGTFTASSHAFAYQRGRSEWLHGRQIVFRHRDNAAQFSTWFDVHEGRMIAGRDLMEWAYWAAFHDRLPAAVCGKKSLSASTLFKRINVMGNPPDGFALPARRG